MDAANLNGQVDGEFRGRGGADGRSRDSSHITSAVSTPFGVGQSRISSSAGGLRPVQLQQLCRLHLLTPLPAY